MLEFVYFVELFEAKFFLFRYLPSYVVITCIFGEGGKRGQNVNILKVESTSLFKIYMVLCKEEYWKKGTVKTLFSYAVFDSCR